DRSYDCARRGVDEGDAIFPVDGGEQQPAVGLHSETVRSLSDLDRMRDAIRRRVDRTDGRPSVAADINAAAVRRLNHAMWARGNRHRRDDYASVGIDHAHRVVFEIA